MKRKGITLASLRPCGKHIDVFSAVKGNFLSVQAVDSSYGFKCLFTAGDAEAIHAEGAEKLFPIVLHFFVVLFTYRRFLFWSGNLFLLPGINIIDQRILNAELVLRECCHD